MSNSVWRFPPSQFGQKKGLSTGDSETFKGRPYQAFAREILQNSIDARKNPNVPVKVEFKTFYVDNDKLPGTTELKAAVRRCKEYWAHKSDYVNTYSDMENILEQPSIQCLRISDFNTKGLVGVESDIQEKNAFLALTKGSGVSEKDDDVAGGSKGVGKNAAILMSEIRTIFYSTHTCMRLDKTPDEQKGYLGVADFVSGYVRDDYDSEKRDYTQGPGYFSVDDYNRPEMELFNIDPSFSLRESECGTDVYIIGFNGENSWEIEVINSLLDSFLVAIVKGDLEVILNERIINKETIKELIYDTSLIYKRNYGNLISQYRMLSGDEKVQVFKIETEYGECDLYVLPLSEEEDELATHKCVMVRHPLMKIKAYDLGASFRVSALCIIDDGPLGKVLRDIENTEHNDWQTKRIKDKNKRKEIENLISEIRQQIYDNVLECLKMGDMEPLDPNGAGDYLPDIDPGKGKAEDVNKTPSEKVSVISVKENTIVEKNANQPNEYGQGLEPFIGGQDNDTEGDVQHPGGENEGGGGEHHPGSETGGEKEGDEELFRKTQLSGVKYKVISTDKTAGKMRVVFVAPIDYENCYLQIKLLDDANNSSKVDISEMKCKGVPVGGNDIDGYGPFQIKRNEKIVLDVTTNRKGYFASEVKVICK